MRRVMAGLMVLISLVSTGCRDTSDTSDTTDTTAITAIAPHYRDVTDQQANAVADLAAQSAERGLKTLLDNKYKPVQTVQHGETFWLLLVRCDDPVAVQCINAAATYEWPHVVMQLGGDPAEEVTFSGVSSLVFPATDPDRSVRCQLAPQPAAITATTGFTADMFKAFALLGRGVTERSSFITREADLRIVLESGSTYDCALANGQVGLR